MRTRRPVFKPYYQHQASAFPPTLDELVPKEHVVRVVNEVIEKISIEPLIERYKGGGSSSYHPRMLLKVIVFGYLNNIYSSRKLELALQENIYFMWLSGMEKPDHNTINRFRSERLKGVIKEVFTQVVILLAESGHVDLQQVYTDGTKIEANANRYTFVWGRAIKTSKERIARQLEELWEYTQKVASQELKESTMVSQVEIEPEKVSQTIEAINQALKDKPVDAKIKRKLKYAQKHWPQKLQQYQKQEQILGQRNSYSKTDEDATFMRMKEDHMLNGQLKPGYNVQISTNNQLIVHYSLHQNPTDTKTLKPHLESFQQAYGFMPKELTADGGYGSQENYEFLEENQIEAYVKYNYFDKERQNPLKSKGPFHVDNLFYNKSKNCYYCPMGQPMHFIGYKRVKTETGYPQVLSRYQAINCQGCPLRGACHKSSNHRIIEVNHRANELRTKARERLLSEKGISHCKRRCIDVEPVFGMLKHNWGFRRFMLRGIEKTSIEFGLLALAHNIRKLFVIQLLTTFLNLINALLRRIIKVIIQRNHPSTSIIESLCPI